MRWVLLFFTICYHIMLHLKYLRLTGSWEPSTVSSTSSAGYKLLSATIKSEYGSSVLVALIFLAGETDSRHFIPIADNAYRFFPLAVNESDLIRFHGTDERFAIKDFIEMIRFYYVLILK